MKNTIIRMKQYNPKKTEEIIFQKSYYEIFIDLCFTLKKFQILVKYIKEMKNAKQAGKKQHPSLVRPNS